MIITEKYTNKVLCIGPAKVEDHETFYVIGTPGVALMKSAIIVYDTQYEGEVIDYTAKDWYYTETEGFYLKPEPEPEKTYTLDEAAEVLAQEVSQNGYDA